jgi:hypothetical protein
VVTNQQPTERAGRTPAPGRQMRKSVIRITDGARLPLYPYGPDNSIGGRYVMTWTSDRTGVLLYTIIGMLFVLSSIYLPA